MKNLTLMTFVALTTLATTTAFANRTHDFTKILSNSKCPVTISNDWLVASDQTNYSLGGRVVALSGDCKLLQIEDNFVSKGRHKRQNTEKIENIYFPRPDICKGKDNKIVCEPEACLTEGETTVCWGNYVHVKDMNIQHGFVSGINRFKNKVSVQYVDESGNLQYEELFLSPSELVIDIVQPQPGDIADVIDEEQP